MIVPIDSAEPRYMPNFKQGGDVESESIRRFSDSRLTLILQALLEMTDFEGAIQDLQVSYPL